MVIFTKLFFWSIVIKSKNAGGVDDGLRLSGRIIDRLCNEVGRSAVSVVVRKSITPKNPSGSRLWGRDLVCRGELNDEVASSWSNPMGTFEAVRGDDESREILLSTFESMKDSSWSRRAHGMNRDTSGLRPGTFAHIIPTLTSTADHIYEREAYHDTSVVFRWSGALMSRFLSLFRDASWI